jgi:agmatinase
MAEHRADASRFLSCVTPDDPRAPEARVGVVAIPHDGSVTYRSGASRGPAAIRAASDSIETYCPRQDRDLADFVTVDLGDLSPPGARDGAGLVASWAEQLAALPPLRLLVLGGDHLVAYAPVTRAMEAHPDLQIIHIDAHADMREHWEGEVLNHATVMGRIRDRMGPGHRVHQWGIRSGTRAELGAARVDQRFSLLPEGEDAGVELARALAGAGKPIYVTLDVDGIDPAHIPGTGTPEPGGLSYLAVERMLAELVAAEADVVGADLVELAPDLDPTGRSAVAVARLARTLVLVLEHARGRGG